MSPKDINIFIYLPLLLSTTTFFCLVISNNFILVETIEPELLWVAINTTLASEKIKPECVKIVLYNEDAEFYVKENYTGNGSLLINIDGNQPDGFMTEKLTDEVKLRSEESKKFYRCIVVISLVNTTKELEEMESNDDKMLQDKKFGLSEQFTKMLQFGIPVNQRSLFLVRFGDKQTDFGICRNKLLPYLKYPRRLVPLWEQVLFDFFPWARALHAIKGEKMVQTRREEGGFIWMCEEVIQRLDAEQQCKMNLTEECQEKADHGGFSAVGLNLTACSTYKPRM